VIAAHASATTPSGPLALGIVVGHPSATAFALVADALVVAAAGLYVAGVWRRGREGAGHWSPWRVASFLGGLVCTYVAVGSGLAHYTARPSVVVVQHVLLMMAAPPLLVLGRPKVVLAGVRSRQADPACDPKMTPSRGRGRGRGRGLGVWTLYYGSMAAFFLTPLFPRSLHDPALLDGSELWFTAVGLAFSAYVVGSTGTTATGRPIYWSRIVAVLAGAPVETAVGLALLLWPRPLAAGVSLGTTHTAGLVLWAGGMLTSGLALAYVLGLWCLDDMRRGTQLDLLMDTAAAPVSLEDAPGSVRP
jgi:putative membrane protein